MTVSVFMLVYNEIRFIRRTLESIIAEADEILISDYGSTDGTLDVLEEFSVKYPKIIYAIHKDVPTSDRYDWFIQNVQGKYVRVIGGHDMVSSGSSKSMVALLESNPDAVMVYSKYCINLNSDYTFNSFKYMHEQNIDTFMSDFSSLRVASTLIHFCLPSIYYGLYKYDTYLDVLRFLQSIFTNKIVTDTGVIAAMLKRGKLICDESSIFFWMLPREQMDAVSEYKRMSKMQSNTNSSPFYWPFVTICQCFASAKGMKPTDDNFSQSVLDSFIKMHSFLFDLLPEKITPADTQQVMLDHKCLYDEVFGAILEYQDKQATPIETTPIETTPIETTPIETTPIETTPIETTPIYRVFCFAKKLIKYALPYGLVRFIQKKLGPITFFVDR